MCIGCSFGVINDILIRLYVRPLFVRHQFVTCTPAMLEAGIVLALADCLFVHLSVSVCTKSQKLLIRN